MFKDAFVITLLLACTAAAAGEGRSPALARPPKPPKVRVAVIDTGLDLQDDRFKPYLCEDGHRDFTGTKIDDEHGHGTHVAGLIIKNALPSKNFCLIILKYYIDGATGRQNGAREISAFVAAVEAHADYVNFSGGGPELVQEEISIIQQTRKTQWIFAAGNDNRNVCPFPDELKAYRKCEQENRIRRMRDVEQLRCPDEPYAYYPACYIDSNIIVVGSTDENGKKAVSSNTGPRVDAWEQGDNQLSTLPKASGQLTGYMSGTSQATAVHTGKLLSKDPRAK